MQLQFTTDTPIPGPTILHRMSPLEKFWALTRLDRECWIWKGVNSRRTSINGYGHINKMPAHRWSYEHFIGPIPEGLQIDHLCRNRACVNPYHLEAVTSKENILRGEGTAARQHRRTVCIHGHPFTRENVYLDPRGARKCKVCRRRIDRNRPSSWMRSKQKQLEAVTAGQAAKEIKDSVVDVKTATSLQ